MFKTIASTLPDAAAVTEQLVAHYGADRVWQVEQLSEHFSGQGSEMDLWPWRSSSRRARW